MLSKVTIALATMLIFAFLISEFQVEGRYLPTRSNGDRIDKLRELLKDLLESEIEKEETESSSRWRPDSKYFVKREAIPTKKEPTKVNVQSA